MHSSIHVFICPSMHPFIHSCIHPSLKPCIHLCIHLSIPASFHLFIHPSQSGVLHRNVLRKESWPSSKDVQLDYNSEESMSVLPGSLEATCLLLFMQHLICSCWEGLRRWTVTLLLWNRHLLTLKPPTGEKNTAELQWVQTLIMWRRGVTRGIRQRRDSHGHFELQGMQQNRPDLLMNNTQSSDMTGELLARRLGRGDGEIKSHGRRVMKAGGQKARVKRWKSAAERNGNEMSDLQGDGWRRRRWKKIKNKIKQVRRGTRWKVWMHQSTEMS